MRLMILIPPLLAFVATPLLAQNGPAYFDPSQVNVTYGVFCAVQTEGVKEAPGTEAGAINLYSEVPEFEWNTALVPAMLGMTFGIKTDVLTDADLSGVFITVTHPPFPDSGTSEEVYITNFEVVGQNINAYSFDMPYEVQRGTWTFTATVEGKQIYSMDFKVVDPALVPNMAGSCHGTIIS